MKAVQLKITTGILQGVPPMSSFLYLISLVDVVSVPLIEGGYQNFARGFPTRLYFFTRLTPESESPFPSAVKNLGTS